MANNDDDFCQRNILPLPTSGHDAQILPLAARDAPGLVVCPADLDLQHGLDDWTPSSWPASAQSSSSGGMATQQAPHVLLAPGSILQTSSSSSDNGVACSQPASSRRHKLERKGHTKSRRGCFNCKRRRIKVYLQNQKKLPVASLAGRLLIWHPHHDETVSGESPGLWSLYQEQPELRVSRSTSSSAPGK